MSCARVDEAALATLPSFPALTGITTIDLGDAGFRHVGRCQRLERLQCMYCRETTDDATEHLRELLRLRTYYAGMTRITDRSLETLGRLPALEELEFWQVTGLTDGGVASLRRLPKLRSLRIDGSPNVTRAVARRFPSRVHVTLTG